MHSAQITQQQKQKQSDRLMHLVKQEVVFYKM